FLGRALPGKAAQPAQRQLDAAGVQLDIAAEGTELAAVPYLHRTEAVIASLSDADPFGVRSVCTIRACDAGTDPAIAALMPALLLGQTLAEGLQQLVQPAHRLEPRAFLRAQRALERATQPVVGNRRRQRILDRRRAVEERAEAAV